MISAIEILMDALIYHIPSRVRAASADEDI